MPAMLAVLACAPPIEREPLTPAVTEPPPPAVTLPQATPPPGPPPHAARRERALALQHQGDLAAALLHWRVLSTLAPGDPEVERQTAAVRALIHQRTGVELAAGAAAEHSGDAAGARSAYLRVLALDPTNGEALASLRQQETARVHAALQTRLDSLRARRADHTPREGNDNGQARDYRDTGLGLYEAGDLEASVLELRKYLGEFPEDAAVRDILEKAERRLHEKRPPGADSPAPAPPPDRRPPGPSTPPEAGATPAPTAAAVTAAAAQAAQEYYEQGLRMHRQDIGAAIHLWQQALEQDPGHVQARLRLEQAQKMRRRLEAIDKR